MISFTSTATCRPEIFAQTLRSFRDNLLGVRLAESAIYLNIDPVPDQVNTHKVFKLATMTFRDVFLHLPGNDGPSFPAAVKWCWSKPETEFFFHLEDDWELTVPTEVGPLLDLLNSDPSLSCVNLRAYTGILDDRICLSPGLLRSEHAREIASRLVLTANPEKQLRAKSDENPEGGKADGFKGMQYPTQNSVGSPLIRDIGRGWLHGSGWQKNGDPYHFTAWQKVAGAAEPPPRCRVFPCELEAGHRGPHQFSADDVVPMNPTNSTGGPK